MSDNTSTMDRIAKVLQWMITILLVAFAVYYIAMKVYNHTAIRDFVDKSSGG